VNVRFDVYGANAAELNAHADGALEDFGPHLRWTWAIDAEQALHLSADTWVGHVTAESTPT
jgi:hypothetical protein